jgi:hypothetical protein
VTTTTEKALPAREILLVGPYGVLGTGVLDAAAANPAWRITTAARRPPPTYRASTALRHMHVDLLDRKGTMQVFSDLSTVTELVFAAYVRWRREYELSIDRLTRQCGSSEHSTL